MPDEQTPELIPRFRYSKNWENPADYATHQHSEIQNRRDIQSLFTEIASYINNVMLPRAEQLLSESGTGGGSGTGGVADGDYLPLDGGTMRGILRLYREPQLDAEAATKHYADTIIGGVSTDIGDSLDAIRQTADALDSLTQSHGRQIASLQVQSDEISGTVSGLRGQVSTVSQRANAIETRVTNAEGDISTIRQTVSGISLSVSTVTEHGEVYSKITLRIGQQELYGYIKMEGNVDISGTVSGLRGQVSTVSQRANAIETRVTNAEGDISTIRQTVDGISLSTSTLTEHGEVYSKITLRIGQQELYGYIRMDGNVDISGQLSADALYAGYGEVANLSVDTLNTSRRIVRYLSGDASDDNFIRAQGQNLEWVTAHPTGGTTQAKNPDGLPLYWPVNVANLSRGADGYPVTAQQERIFTTTAPTSYPVQVYTYTEDVKRAISFEPFNGIYSPVDRFGAGNQQGNNKAWILKTADGFDIRYLTPDAREIGIHMGTDGKVTIDGMEYDAEKIRALLGMSGESGSGLDLTQINPDGSASGLSVDANGYTDISGLRKVTALDFSNIETGFSETLDGGIFNAYSVRRDASGRITGITDAAGHETVVTWGD